VPHHLSLISHSSPFANSSNLAQAFSSHHKRSSSILLNETAIIAERGSWRAIKAVRAKTSPQTFPPRCRRNWQLQFSVEMHYPPCVIRPALSLKEAENVFWPLMQSLGWVRWAASIILQD
jgi:hypothetical protein